MFDFFDERVLFNIPGIFRKGLGSKDPLSSWMKKIQKKTSTKKNILEAQGSLMSVWAREITPTKEVIIRETTY